MVPKVILAGWFSWSAWNGFPGFRGARSPLLVGVFSYSLRSRFLDSFPGLRGLVSRACSHSFFGSWLIFWYVHFVSVVWICESAVVLCFSRVFLLASLLAGRLFTQLSVTFGRRQNLAPKWFQKLEPKVRRF